MFLWIEQTGMSDLQDHVWGIGSQLGLILFFVFRNLKVCLDSGFWNVGFSSYLGFGFWDLEPAAAAALTAFCAASARSSAGISSTPLFFKSCFPFSTFVPSSLTTTGTESFTVFAALIIPCAITSTFMIPPKILTRIAFTFLSAIKILNASVTCSSVAPPPTSRKFAGLP